MRDDLPRMLYKYPGPYEIWGEMYDYLIVFTDDELASGLANGWAYTPFEAKEKAATPPPVQPYPEPSGDDAPPTREELEQKATELGIAFDGRTSNKTLAAKINAALTEVT